MYLFVATAHAHTSWDAHRCLSACGPIKAQVVMFDIGRIKINKRMIMDCYNELINKLICPERFS